MKFICLLKKNLYFLMIKVSGIPCDNPYEITFDVSTYYVLDTRFKLHEVCVVSWVLPNQYDFKPFLFFLLLYVLIESTLLIYVHQVIIIWPNSLTEFS